MLAGGVGERNDLHGLQNDHADEENGNHGHEPVLVGKGRRQREVDFKSVDEFQHGSGDGNRDICIERFPHDGTERLVHQL